MQKTLLMKKLIAKPHTRNLRSRILFSRFFFFVRPFAFSIPRHAA